MPTWLDQQNRATWNHCRTEPRRLPCNLERHPLLFCSLPANPRADHTAQVTLEIGYECRLREHE
jgi:hypothetical protein